MFPMEVTRFGQFLVNNDVVTDAMVMEALVRQEKAQENIARIAIGKRYLTVKQVLTVFNAQADSCDSFTVMAKKLGYLTENEIAALLSLQQQSRPRLGEILVDMGVLDNKTLDIMLAKFSALNLGSEYSNTG